MDAESTVRQAIVGVIPVLTLIVVLVLTHHVPQAFQPGGSLRSLVVAVGIALVVWVGFVFEMLFGVVFRLLGGYEGPRRPCLSEIVSRYSTHRADDDPIISPERLTRLAYYAWAYAQERDESALSGTVITRIARGWRRVHFLGANALALAVASLGLTIELALTTELRETWLVVATIGGWVLALSLLLVLIDTFRRLLRLERFIVHENWDFLYRFLVKNATIAVETF